MSEFKFENIEGQKEREKMCVCVCACMYQCRESLMNGHLVKVVLLIFLINILF